MELLPFHCDRIFLLVHSQVGAFQIGEVNILIDDFRFSINILTKYENNNGSTENCLEASGETLKARKVGSDAIKVNHSFSILKSPGGLC